MLLLEHLANNGEQPLGTIASAVGQTRPTAHRILSSLVSLGFVDRKHDGVYNLTDKLRRIALGGGDARLVNAARTPLVQLRARSGETANLGVLRGTRVQYLHTISSEYSLRRIVTPGETDPFYCTALGRVMAASLPESTVLSMLRNTPLMSRSEQTETDPGRLLDLVRRAGQDGYAVEQDQTDLGVYCIAAPVRSGREWVAAVSVSGVLARLGGQSFEPIIRLVIKAADQASKNLVRNAEQ